MLGYPQQPLGGGTLGNVGATGVQGLITDPTAGMPGGLLGNYHPALATYYNGMPTQIIRRSLRGDRLTDPNYDPRVIPGHPSPAPGLPTPPGTESPPDVATPGGAAPAAGMSDFQKWLQGRNDPGDNLVEEDNFSGIPSGGLTANDPFTFDPSGGGQMNFFGPESPPGFMGSLMSNISPASLLGTGLSMAGFGIPGMIAGQALAHMMPELSQPLFGGGGVDPSMFDQFDMSIGGVAPGSAGRAFYDPGYGYGMGDLGYGEDGGAFDDFGGEAAFDAGDIDAVGDDSW